MNKWHGNYGDYANDDDDDEENGKCEEDDHDDSLKSKDRNSTQCAKH